MSFVVVVLLVLEVSLEGLVDNMFVHLEEKNALQDREQLISFPSFSSYLPLPLLPHRPMLALCLAFADL